MAGNTSRVFQSPSCAKESRLESRTPSPAPHRQNSPCSGCMHNSPGRRSPQFHQHSHGHHRNHDLETFHVSPMTPKASQRGMSNDNGHDDYARYLEQIQRSPRRQQSGSSNASNRPIYARDSPRSVVSIVPTPELININDNDTWSHQSHPVVRSTPSPPSRTYIPFSRQNSTDSATSGGSNGHAAAPPSRAARNPFQSPRTSTPWAPQRQYSGDSTSTQGQGHTRLISAYASPSPAGQGGQRVSPRVEMARSLRGSPGDRVPGSGDLGESTPGVEEWWLEEPRQYGRSGQGAVRGLEIL